MGKDQGVTGRILSAYGDELPRPCSHSKKSGARLASPQPRPASPVNGAGGITGFRNDAQAKKSFQPGCIYFLIFS
jgi:hypothetical protein